MSRYTELRARSRPAPHAMIAGTAWSALVSGATAPLSAIEIDAHRREAAGVYWTPAAREWLDRLGPVETPPECRECGCDLEPDADEGLCPGCAIERIYD